MEIFRNVRRVLLAVLLVQLFVGCDRAVETPAQGSKNLGTDDATAVRDKTSEIAVQSDRVTLPDPAVDREWLAQQGDAQRIRAKSVEVFSDFRFRDQIESSGIDFRHFIVDDAGKAYKAVHYDHGNGVAIADIDNDQLLDIYFISQAGSNGLYRNLGEGRFANVTKQAGVSVDDAIGVSASFADIDNDGDADLYVTNVRSPNRLFLNRGDGTFEDVSRASGIDVNEHSSGATFFDYNRDGRLDLFLSVVGEYTTNETLPVSAQRVTRDSGQTKNDYWVGHRDAFSGHLKPERFRRSRLFRNDGDATFSDVTEEVGLIDEGWTGDATVVDFNNDLWPDLYALNMQGNDHYWVNMGGTRFENQQASVFPRTPWGAMGVKSFDIDNDGHFDLLISDMHSDMSEDIGPEHEKLKATWIEKNWSPNFLKTNGASVYGNALFKNNGSGQFEEVSDAVNLENYWPWGVSVGDLNADGWQDVVIISSMNFPFRYVPNKVYLNVLGQQFFDAEFALGIEPRQDGEMTQAWFDLDCSAGDRDHKLCDGRDGTLAVHGAKGSRSAVLFDLDTDGDLDIVTNEFGNRPQVLISDLAQVQASKLNYLEIQLIGRTSNRDGIGATVTVVVEGHRLAHHHDGKSGYLSQSRTPLYVGLGKHTNVDSIEVRWPSGVRQKLKGPIASGQRLQIEES